MLTKKFVIEVGILLDRRKTVLEIIEKNPGIRFNEIPQTEKTTHDLHEKLGKHTFTYPQIFNSSNILIGGFEDLLDYTQYEDAVNKTI